MKSAQILSIVALLTSIHSGALSKNAQAQAVEQSYEQQEVQQDSREPLTNEEVQLSLPPNWIEYGSSWIVIENRYNSDDGCVLILPHYEEVLDPQQLDDGYKLYCSMPIPTGDAIDAEFEISFSGSYFEFVTFIVSNVLVEENSDNAVSVEDGEESKADVAQASKLEFTSTIGGGLRYRFMRSIARLIGIELDDAARAALNAEQQAARAAQVIDDASRVARPAPPLTEPSPQLRQAIGAAANELRGRILNHQLRQQAYAEVPAIIRHFITNRARWILDEAAQQQLSQLSAAEQAAFRRALNAQYNAVGEQILEGIRRGSVQLPGNNETIMGPLRSAVMICDEETGLFFRIRGGFNAMGELETPISEILRR